MSLTSQDGVGGQRAVVAVTGANTFECCTHLASVLQVYVMTNKWQFKAVQRMDLGSDSNHGISLSSQKSHLGTNGTAVTASGALDLTGPAAFQLTHVCLRACVRVCISCVCVNDIGHTTWHAMGKQAAHGCPTGSCFPITAWSCIQLLQLQAGGFS